VGKGKPEGEAQRREERGKMKKRRRSKIEGHQKNKWRSRFSCSRNQKKRILKIIEPQKDNSGRGRNFPGLLPSLFKVRKVFTERNETLGGSIRN